MSAMFCLARGGDPALFFLSSPLPPAPRRWSRHRKKLSGYLISHLKFYFSLVPMLVAPIGEGSGPVGRARAGLLTVAPCASSLVPFLGESEMGSLGHGNPMTIGNGMCAMAWWGRWARVCVCAGVRRGARGASPTTPTGPLC